MSELPLMKLVEKWRKPDRINKLFGDRPRSADYADELEAALAAARKQLGNKPIDLLMPIGWAGEKEVREWALREILGEECK